MPLADNERIHFLLAVKGTLAALGGQAQQTVNMFTYRRDLFPAVYNPASLRAAFLAGVQADWLAATSVHWTFDSLDVRCLNDTVEPTSTSTVGVAGGIVGDACPGYTAMVISKVTALRGRFYRGRAYIAGVPESATTGNAITAGQQILLDALALDLNVAIVDADGNRYRPAVLSQSLSTLTTSPATVVATDITSMIGRTVLGRMSSRHSKVS